MRSGFENGLGFTCIEELILTVIGTRKNESTDEYTSEIDEPVDAAGEKPDRVAVSMSAGADQAAPDESWNVDPDWDPVPIGEPNFTERESPTVVANNRSGPPGI
ncbi:hypothetical protein GC170_09865 [bacterium]|nr:hypothetical protein [bacterium]